MSISFRQRRSFTLAAATPTHALIEGAEGTFINGADTISVQIKNTGANLLTLCQFWVDPGGYGSYVLDVDASTTLGTAVAGATIFKRLNPNGAKRIQLILTSAAGTDVTVEVVGVNAQ